MTNLLERLELRLSPLGAEQVKMFGGVCFMMNGNMAVGTSKNGLLVRVGPGNDGVAARKKNASPMIMRDKPMAGYWYVDEGSLTGTKEFEFWIELALGFNKMLPAKARKGKGVSTGRVKGG